MINTRNASFGRNNMRFALIILVACIFLSSEWSGRVFSHSGSVVATTESFFLHADSGNNTPGNRQSEFNRGDKVWAIETGVPFLGQRRFQWVAPDGTVKQQSPIPTTNTDPQSDLYQLSTTAQLGTWKVKTIDNSNVGFAVAEFVVRDPANVAADLSVGVFGSSQVAAGGSIVHRVQVTNNGPDAASDVQLTDTISGGATFDSLTVTGSGNWNCGPGNTTNCSIGSLAKGETTVFTLVYQVPATLPADTTISNAASVSSTTTELHMENDDSTATSTVTVSTCTFTCPPNKTQAHDQGMNGAVVNYDTPTISGCEPVICTPSSGSFFPAGVTAVVCSSGNGGSCAFTVTVTGALTITLDGPYTPDDPLIVECHTAFNEPGVTAQDDSGNTYPVTSSAGTTVDLNMPGTYTINYSASGGGLTATAMRTVNVVDTTPPIISCPANIIATVPNTTDTSMAVSFSVTATDACSTATITSTPASGSLFPLGTTTVTATATDTANPVNVSSCSFTVTVASGLTITLNGDNPLTVECHADFNDPGAIVSNGTPATPSGTVNTDVPGTYTITYTADGTNPLVTATRTVNVVDTTPPAITCPEADVVVTLPANSTATSMAVSYSATAIDACSTAIVTLTPASGSIFPVGTTTVTATATDAMGNTSPPCSFTVTVLYNFSGFFQPISNPPTLNVVQAGRAIPVKFSLSGNKGLNIFASNSPASGVLECGADQGSEVQETVTAGSSSLSYNSATDQYVYVWKTEEAWAGTCRQLVVTLNDGSVYRADFKFR